MSNGGPTFLQRQLFGLPEPLDRDLGVALFEPAYSYAEATPKAAALKVQLDTEARAEQRLLAWAKSPAGRKASKKAFESMANDLRQIRGPNLGAAYIDEPFITGSKGNG